MSGGRDKGRRAEKEGPGLGLCHHLAELWVWGEDGSVGVGLVGMGHLYLRVGRIHFYR